MRNKYDILYPDACTVVNLEKSPPLRRYFNECLDEFKESDISDMTYHKALRATGKIMCAFNVSFSVDDEEQVIYAHAWEAHYEEEDDGLQEQGD